MQRSERRLNAILEFSRTKTGRKIIANACALFSLCIHFYFHRTKSDNNQESNGSKNATDSDPGDDTNWKLRRWKWDGDDIKVNLGLEIKEVKLELEIRSEIEVEVCSPSFWAVVTADGALQQLASPSQHQVVEFAVPSQEISLAETPHPLLGTYKVLLFSSPSSQNAHSQFIESF